MALNNTDCKILLELLKNSRISDRQLAKKLGISQPTVTRRRAKLEKEGAISYIGRPDFLKMGFSIMAFNFTILNNEAEKLSMARSKKYLEKVASFLKDNPNIIFATSGRGMGMNRLSISLHKNYTDYVRYKEKLNQEWAKYAKENKTFIVSLDGDNIVKEFSFDSLMNLTK
ncbi:MAG: winged helix-turn-helix transcriptional regulator [Candidatus Bathyarchaeota archaeon]|jgi:Lrp/AsnC family leucine-responsive transcriptional regulator